MFVCRFSPVQRPVDVAARRPAATGVAYGQTVDVHNIFPSPLCGCHSVSAHYDLSPNVKIHHHRHVRSSNAS